MKYFLSGVRPSSQLIKINAEFEVDSEVNFVFKLPDWRPGRYELGNFSKNVKDLVVKDQDGNCIKFKKRKRNEWLVFSKGFSQVEISYSYYAKDLNAGSTFLNETLFYVNPVNCLVYPEFGEDNDCLISIDIPREYKIASSLEFDQNHQANTKTFHELVDSPIVASSLLQSKSYESHGVKCHVWFQGECKPDWERLLDDFKRFSDYQINKFGSLPVPEFHFINIISTFKAYHGVEHLGSTMIHLGPSYDIFGKLYTELLGVSSHELYHVWNIKSIRPVELYPYDYSKENYTEMGYVAEGVTTYMGDRTLYESGVFDRNQYNKELGNYITRHFHNDGRNHLSVAESGFDTWVDGYVSGTPGRKTSIYVEGCMVSYIIDMRIREKSQGQRSLHDVMRKMYEITGLKLGYDEGLYKGLIESEGAVNVDDVFTKLIHGTDDYLPYLKKALEFDGVKFSVVKSDKYTRRYGLKGLYSSGRYVVKQIKEGSAVDVSGVSIEDEIHAVNGLKLDGNLEEWLNYFKDVPLTIQIYREGRLLSKELNSPNESQYLDYKLS